MRRVFTTEKELWDYIKTLKSYDAHVDKSKNEYWVEVE